MAINPKLYTVEEYEAIADAPENRERLLELIHGEIVEKMPTEEHGGITGLFVTEFNLYFRKSKIGRTGSHIHYQVVDDKHNARLPDVSVRIVSPDVPLVKKGAVMTMPDLAIEIKSPDDSIFEMRETAKYYLENGSRLVWLVFPLQRIIEVYALNEDVKILVESDTLDGGDVLPNFTLAVKDVFN